MEISSSRVVDLAEYRAQHAVKGPDSPNGADRSPFSAPSPFRDRNTGHRERMLRHLLETAARALASAGNRG